ncbi:Alpha/Beta hydrolase protein [Aspergillus ambiguus]|uniref:alpha/beta fold hydrolase n=1 Tax=Aspergillus ambiguus TaxID=176160 RepID=UPI003CCDD4A1
MKKMCGHMAEILDKEGVSRAIAVAHDWGVGLGSRLATYQRHRIYGLVTVAVSYVEPGTVWDIDAICNLTKSLVGYETSGYWLWHNTDEAVVDCETNPASTFNLVYPYDPLLWIADFAPIGKAAEFVRAGRTTPLPSWYSLADYTVRDRIFAKGGYAGPLSWYKAAMRGVNTEDETAVPEEDIPWPLPNLFVAAKRDYVCRADLQSELARKWVPNCRIETVDCGHWVQLEKPDILNKFLVGFARDVAGNEKELNDASI